MVSRIALTAVLVCMIGVSENAFSRTCEKPNMIFMSCGHCAGTCSRPNPTCGRMCHMGCHCKPGYVHEFEGGECIEKDQCGEESTMCSHMHNAVWNPCSSECPKYCPNHEKDCTLAFSTAGKCIGRCECKVGYVLHEGECIAEGQCKEKDQCLAKKYMTWNNCAPVCSPYCDGVKIRTACLYETLGFECIGRCLCKKGYSLWNDECIENSQCKVASDCTDKNHMEWKDGKCECKKLKGVSEFSCRHVTRFMEIRECYLRPNRRWDNCAKSCDKVCPGKSKPPCDLPRYKCTSKCRCKYGYYIQGFSCVRRSECHNHQLNIP